MDYVEAFQNLRTNNKYGRRSPHKAVMMLTVIELYEQNVLSENEIFYDDTLKSMFLKVWNRVLSEEPLFHSEAYLPFWYLQSDSFWHIVPNRGKEDILSLMRDTNVKPSEAKLCDCVKYAELDDDLYFLMTLPSGRSSLKKALLETYTNLSERQVDRLSESVDNAIDYSVSALSDYEKILYNEKDEKDISVIETDNGLVRQFHTLNEDIQIVLNLQYYSFLKSHRGEREMFKEICPTVYSLFDKIVNHPIKQCDIAPSFAFTYDNFLSDLKIALMSEDGSMELIDRIGEAIDLLRGNVNNLDSSEPVSETRDIEPSVDIVEKSSIGDDNDSSSGDMEVEHVFLDSSGQVIEKISSSQLDLSVENRRGKAWTQEEEELITRYFNEGRSIAAIATTIGRTEVAIKARLAKLGLIDYTYRQEEETPSKISIEKKEEFDEKGFRIENAFTRCSILNKYGERVFSTEGKLKYIGGKLYRLNLKNECFTIKSMRFDGSIWLKGDKKIVAYPRTELYRIIDNALDYWDEVEDIVDSPVFENCKLKVKGIWYMYNGELVSDNKEKVSDAPKRPFDRLRIIRGPLYAVRKQAVLRAMSFFRLPTTIKNISRTISRTAWRDTIKEEDVEDIVKTMSEVESVEGKYILRKD